MIPEIKISQDKIEQFQNDGAVHLKNVFDEKWVEKVSLAIQKTMENPSEFSEMLRPQENEG